MSTIREDSDELKRIFARELVTLSPDGRPCEACGDLMRDHQWVDLNISGFVVACSNPTYSLRRD